MTTHSAAASETEAKTDAAPEAEREHQPVKGPRIKKGLSWSTRATARAKRPPRWACCSALGGAICAWRCSSSLKHTGSRFGESRAAEKLGIPMSAMGDGFTWRTKNMETTQDLGRAQWENCKKAILSGEHDVIILDEFTYPLHYGWIPVDDVIETLKRKPHMLHVIITGRYAPDELVEFADLVTEMREIKHPYREQGIKAQPGLEFRYGG